MPRDFRLFVHKDANLHIACTACGAVTRALVEARAQLEAYLERQPEFRTTFAPLTPLADAPVIARRMAAAAACAGVGPMAAVAGAMAQWGAEAGLAAGAAEAVVENGGDIFLRCAEPITIGLHAGASPLADSLAFRVHPEETPLALCSSSGTMGHSRSLGVCDLATVAAADGALADAAATRAANCVRAPEDIDATLETVLAIPGVRGVLLVKGERIGMAGTLPELVRNRDADLVRKVTRDRRAPALPARGR